MCGATNKLYGTSDVVEQTRLIYLSAAPFPCHIPNGRLLNSQSPRYRAPNTLCRGQTDGLTLELGLRMPVAGS